MFVLSITQNIEVLSFQYKISILLITADFTLDPIEYTSIFPCTLFQWHINLVGKHSTDIWP